MSTVAVLLAGGSGTRLKRADNKVYLNIGDRPLLAWSLDVFERSPLIDRIVLVVREGDDERAQRIIATAGITKVDRLVRGGPTRHESEHAALEAIAPEILDGSIDLVLIHDAARPFVRQSLLARIVHTAAERGGAVPGLPVDGDFLLRVTEDDTAPTPVPTDQLRRVQTPQAFHAAPLLSAYRRASADGFHGVDTAGSIERYSDLHVELVPGAHDNVKITYVEDLLLAQSLALAWDPDEFDP
ncbi:MAG: 2-C-methyl-D-erythritol 4-phosphate cytidylyltransferase [Nitriliruptoraceae bacterium]|nr:2-C-methyl-D-erythritol 4-phosphate cytidylyltransferase [Nitriliruptoraceae bacterium]